MAFNEKLANRIREELVDIPMLEEKLMFGGLCFMVDDKICLGVYKDEMLCRIDTALVEKVLEMTGCRPMDFTGKSMKSFVLISDEAMKTRKEFRYWIELSLEFNSRAKASKRKKKKS